MISIKFWLQSVYRWLILWPSLCGIPISIGIFNFFQKTDFILKESVLLETRLLGEVFSRLSKIFIALLRSKQFFVCHQCHFEYLAFLFFFKMPKSPKIFDIFIFLKNAKIAPLFWHDIFILKCHAKIFWMEYININIWH